MGRWDDGTRDANRCLEKSALATPLLFSKPIASVAEMSYLCTRKKERPTPPIRAPLPSGRGGRSSRSKGHAPKATAH